MGIFGQLDAASIPSNPFFIEAGNYGAEVTSAKYGTNKDQERQLVIEYTIDDEASEFHGKRAAQYFVLPDEKMTQEDFELLPVEDKRKIQRTISTMKRTLCGNDAIASQRGLGVNPDDLNDDNWNPEILVGTKVNIGIKNYGTNNAGVNVNWVNLRD